MVYDIDTSAVYGSRIANPVFGSRSVLVNHRAATNNLTPTPALFVEACVSFAALAPRLGVHCRKKASS
jgi:hypothetical protein